MIHPSIAGALHEVIDPEIGINIVDLGLVYEASIEEDGSAHVRMAMTSPTCPLGEVIARDVEASVRRHHPEVTTVEVEIVEEPAWSPDRMSDDARSALGWK